MPPSQKRARRYDPVRTRAAVMAQFAHVRAAVSTLTLQQMDGPSGLGAWTVRELAVHLTMALSHVSRNLELPEPALAKPEVTLLEWPFSTAGRAGRIADDTVALAAAHPDVDTLYGEVADRFEALVPGAPEDRLVATRVGAMRLGDFLVTRTVELVVHTYDLNEATGIGVPYDRQALAACTRLLADALAEKAPGARWRYGSRPSRSSNVSRAPGTRAARRPTWSRPTRSPGSGSPPGVPHGHGNSMRPRSAPVVNGRTLPHCCR